MADLGAAVTKPPHLKAIFPLAVSADMCETAYHFGLFSSGFIWAWMPAIGIWQAKTPLVHKRLEHVNGEAITVVLKKKLSRL